MPRSPNGNPRRSTQRPGVHRALVLLSISVAALLTAIWIRFGPESVVVPSVVVSGAYLLLKQMAAGNVDGAIRRVFSPRTSYFAAALTALGALAILFAPALSAAAFRSIEVVAFDESLSPLAGERLSAGLVGAPRFKVVLGSDGRARIKVPRLWPNRRMALTLGPYGADKTISNFVVDLPADRLIRLRAYSGRKIFRVEYISLEGRAIDGVYRGLVPLPIKERYRSLAGIVPNDVWVETGELLKTWGGEPEVEPTQFNVVLDGSEVQDNSAAYRGLREPRAAMVRLQIPADSRVAHQIFNAPGIDRLDERYLVLPGDFDVASADASHTAEQDGRFSANRTRNDYDVPVLFRTLGATDVAKFMRYDAYMQPDILNADLQHDEFLHYLLARAIPGDFAYLSTQFIQAGGACDGPRGMYGLNVLFHFPKPVLRVMIVENITDRPVPLETLHFSVKLSNGIVDRSQTRPVTSREAPGPLDGVLKPGEAIIVPVALEFVGRFPPAALNLRSSDHIAGRLRVVFGGQVGPNGQLLYLKDANETDPIETGVFTLNLIGRQSQLVPSLEFAGPWIGRTFVSKFEIEETEAVVNGVPIPLRMDQRRRLIISDRAAWGGRCDFA